MRSWLETREGQQLLSLVHGWTRAALEMTGAVRVGAAFDKLRTSAFPVSRGIEPEDVVACFERLVELGELRELTVLVTVDADRVFIRERRAEALAEVEASRPNVHPRYLGDGVHASYDGCAIRVRTDSPGSGKTVVLTDRALAGLLEYQSDLVSIIATVSERQSVRTKEPPRGPLTADERKYALETLCFRPPEGLTRADELVLKRLEWEDEQQGGGRDASTAQTGTPGNVLEHEPPQGDSWSGASVSDGEWKGRDS